MTLKKRQIETLKKAYLRKYSLNFEGEAPRNLCFKNLIGKVAVIGLNLMKGTTLAPRNIKDLYQIPF